LVQLARFPWKNNISNQLQTDDPVRAFGYRAEFLERRKHDPGETKFDATALGKLPLKEVAKLFSQMEDCEQFRVNRSTGTADLQGCREVLRLNISGKCSQVASHSRLPARTTKRHHSHDEATYYGPYR
jgi:hypothetical protein